MSLPACPYRGRRFLGVQRMLHECTACTTAYDERLKCGVGLHGCEAVLAGELCPEGWR